MSGWEDSFVPITNSSPGWESSFVPSANQPPPTASSGPQVLGPLSVPQAEAAYTLNSANSIPGLNLIKEAGAGLRGLYAGAMAPSGQSFGDAYTNEYDSSRANQDALMQAGAQQFPVQTTIGKTSGALASMGVLPTPGATGSIAADAALGSATGGGYGVLSGLGNGSSLDDRVKNAVDYGVNGLEFGGLMSGAASGIGQAANGIGGLIKQARLPAVQAAMEERIPIYRNNVSDSKVLQYLSSASNEIPSILGGTSGRVPTQQEAVANALLKPVGDSSGVLNASSVDNALSSSGKQIGDIISQHELPVSSGVLDQLDDLGAAAAGKLTGDNLDNFRNQVAALKALVVNKASGATSSGQGIIPGEQYQAERQWMNNTIQNNQNGPTASLGFMTRRLRNLMDDHFQANMPADDALNLQKARAIYGNASDLSSLTSDTKNPTGDFPLSSVAAKVGDNPNYQNVGLATQLMKNGVGNSGTAQRQLIIKSAQGLGAAGAAAFGLNEVNDGDIGKTAAEMAIAGAGGASIGIANRLVNPEITPQLLNGYQGLQPVSKQAAQLAELLRRSYPAVTQVVGGAGVPQNDDPSIPHITITRRNQQ